MAAASLPPWNEPGDLMRRPGRFRVAKESGHRAGAARKGVERSRFHRVRKGSTTVRSRAYG
jgi:hypothetical protein